MSALAYADDLVLLCPSLLGIQTMLDTCIRVADQFGPVFCSTKSCCDFFGKSVAGLPIKMMTSERYLD